MPKRLKKEFISKNLVVHVTRPCPCMTTSIIIKITRVISVWTPHWITVICHGVEGPMTTGYYCAIFHFVAEEKKKTAAKTKAFYDWASTGIPVMNLCLRATTETKHYCVTIEQSIEIYRHTFMQVSKIYKQWLWIFLTIKSSDEWSSRNRLVGMKV